MFKVTKKITNCRISLLKWHKNKIGNTKKKIDENKCKLEGKRGQDRKLSKEEVGSLKKQLKDAYQEEEKF